MLKGIFSAPRNMADLWNVLNKGMMNERPMQKQNKTKKKQKVGWKGKQNRKVLGGQIPEKNQPEI